MVNHAQDFVAVKKYEILQYSLIPNEDHVNTGNQSMMHARGASGGSGPCPGSLDNCIAACPASPVGGHSSQKVWQSFSEDIIPQFLHFLTFSSYNGL